MTGAWELLPEESLRTAVDLLVRLVEAAGAAVIFIGAVVAVYGFLRALPRRAPDAFVPVRLTLGRFLALGLELQLASDILRTAVSPSFQEIGKLAAIAAIRTALNYFLAREVAEEQRIVDEQRRAVAAAANDAAAAAQDDAAAADDREHPGPPTNRPTDA